MHGYIRLCAVAVWSAFDLLCVLIRSISWWLGGLFRSATRAHTRAGISFYHFNPFSPLFAPSDPFFGRWFLALVQRLLEASGTF